MSSSELTESPTQIGAAHSTALSVPTVDPTAEELAVLSLMERTAFRIAHRMNRGRGKRLMTWLQSTLGMGWIRVSTYNIMNVYGLEHVEACDHTRPLVLAANHRSFFDMYAVSAELYRRTKWEKRLFFPVRGRFFYDSPLGIFVNLIMGWFSMYPPIFMQSEKRAFDSYAFRRLVTLASEGRGHVIGFHPEGTRNKSDDPYSQLRPQPGIGKLVQTVESIQVMPVFIAGLCNNLPQQIARNWNREEQIRIYFGPQIDFTPFKGKRNSLRTNMEVAEFVMSKISQLGEFDRQTQLVAQKQADQHLQ